jgi:hypothetical protein
VSSHMVYLLQGRKVQSRISMTAMDFSERASGEANDI